MASFTRQAIVASFLKLCARKSPDKITVRDIVDDCEINRNTFYYHFQDIYAVVEEVFSVWMEDFNSVCRSGGSMEEALLTVTAWAMAHKRAATNLTLAFDGVALEDYLVGASAEGWSDWLRGNCPEGGREDAFRYVGTTAALGFFSVLRRWIVSSMKEDPEAVVRQYAGVWLSDVEGLIRGYCREQPLCKI